LIPQYSEKLPLATFDYSATGHGSGAEVPIPVLTTDSENIQTNPTVDGTPIPTISVTKAPAPMSVDLPTEHDIVPIDAAYTRGDRERDLEVGKGMMLQEIEHKVEVVTVSKTPPPRTSPMLANSEFAEDTVLVPLPDQPGSSSPSSSVERVGDVDLLSDEGVVLQTPVLTEEVLGHGQPVFGIFPSSALLPETTTPTTAATHSLKHI
jgi:hypothetical protein